MNQDPPRLVDDASDAGLASALRAAQADVLPARSVARVHATLAAAGVVGATATTAAAGASAIKAAAWTTVVKIGLAGLVVGAGAWGWHATRPTEERPVAARSMAASLPSVAAPPAGEATPPPSPLPGIESPAASAPHVAPPSSSARRPEVAAPEPAPREGLLLLEARQVLDADPARALALVRAHEREFPRSQLAPERARIAAEANARLK